MHFTLVNIGWNWDLTFHSVPLSCDPRRADDGASKNKFMLATTDNTRKRPTAAAEVMTADEAAKWFTRPGLAAALKVSVSTIDRMVKSEDLPCVRLRGRVRFYLPVVVVALCKGDRKFGRKADTNFTNCHQGGQAS